MTFHHYTFPSVKGEGWAEVVIGDNGFFATVSDYGNYAFRWTNWGEGSFLEFFLELEADYVCRKLDSTQVLDPDATIKNARKLVGDAYARKMLDKEDIQGCLAELGRVDDEYDLAQWIHDWGWCLRDYSEICSYRPPAQIMAFVTKTLPRIKDAIRNEKIDATKEKP